MRRAVSLCVLLMLLVPWTARAQTNPCTEPLPTGVTIRPTSVMATLPDHTAMTLDGTVAKVAGYELQTFEEGAAAPFFTGPIAKEAWVLQPGTTDCYRAPLDATPLPLNRKLVSRLVALGTEGANSAPSEVSNPFGFPGPPAVGRPRVLR